VPPICRKVLRLALPPDPDADARKALRRAAREARAAFVSGLAGPVRRALEVALAGHALPHLGPPGILGCLAAVGDEADPAPLETAARGAGWRTAFPRVTAGGPLTFHAAALHELSPGFRGIPEPRPGLPAVGPDVVLVPLVAADRNGNRLGQGGGHYDRTLAALRAQGPLLAIGLAWDMQIMADIPARPWDQPLDAIATPTAFHLMPHAARGRA
jgi:5-formyltetrahydrofolate cyclo-ligase